MGAWIETVIVSYPPPTGTVAPYVGAWIETDVYIGGLLDKGSHLTWVRGLKRIFANKPYVINMSHLTWVRGLK